jgi:hypothetical protein
MGLLGSSKASSSSSQKQETYTQQGNAAPNLAGSGAQGNFGLTTGSGSGNVFTINNAGMETLTPVLGHAITAVVDANRLSVDANRASLDMAERVTRDVATINNYAVSEAINAGKAANDAVKSIAKDAVAMAGKVTGKSLSTYNKVNANSLALAERLAVNSMDNSLSMANIMANANSSALAWADTATRSDEAKLSGDLVRYGSFTVVAIGLVFIYFMSKK